IYAAEKCSQLGARVIACSDSNGYVVDERGLNLEVLKQVKELERGRLTAYAERAPHARHVAGGSVWDVPCDVAIPSATHNEISRGTAISLVKNGCIAVSEGANMPTAPEGIRVFLEAGIAYGPGKAANAGGVATSALEMQQNASRDSWSFEYTERRLEQIMRDVHAACHEAAEEYGSPGNLVLGANVTGF